jgi:hypothetical protein
MWRLPGEATRCLEPATTASNLIHVAVVRSTLSVNVKPWGQKVATPLHPTKSKRSINPLILYTPITRYGFYVYTTLHDYGSVELLQPTILPTGLLWAMQHMCHSKA